MIPKRLYTLISLATVVSVWWLVAEIAVVPELFIPHPASVLRAFSEIAAEGYRGSTLAVHLGVSMARLGAGFLLAAVTAIPIGFFMGSHRVPRALFEPVLEFYRPLPPLAYYTLLIVWLGIGDASKVALLYLAAFPPLVLASMAAVDRVPPERIETASSLGARRRDIVWRVLAPSCLPQIFTGLRISIGFAYTTLVSAEIVAAANGIGWMVLDAGRFLRTDVIFVAIAVMGTTGMILDGTLRLLARIFVPWREQ